jgi:hypothetical protein
LASFLRLDRFTDFRRKSSSWLPLPSLTPRKRARINSELAGEFLLRHPKRFAMIDQSMCHCGSILERIESEKFDHSGGVIDAGRTVSFLPIDDRHLVAADHFGGVDLPKSEIKPTLPDRLAQGLRIGRIALRLSKMGGRWGNEAPLMTESKKAINPWGVD